MTINSYQYQADPDVELLRQSLKAFIIPCFMKLRANIIETNGKVGVISKEIEAIGKKRNGNFIAEKYNNRNKKVHWRGLVT